MRRMLMTPMFLAVAKKSRTFFSFSCSAKEQVCRSWEGAQPGSELKLAAGNISHDRCHAQFINGSWPGGGIIFFLILFFLSFP